MGVRSKKRGMPHTKKAVVTGGAGFIGSHVVDALIRGEYDVHVVDDLSAGKRERIPAEVSFHEIDIRDTAALVAVFNDTDAVFHLAAKPRVPYSIEHPVETDTVNVGGTVSVLTAARDAGVRRVVYSASSSAYGNQEEMPLSEHLSPHPLSPYGLQKYVGELYAKLFSELYGLETVSLRYFNVYGPRLDPNGAYALVVGRFLKQRADGEPMTITGDGEQTRDFTHVLDVARANLLAATSAKVGKGEVINIGAGEPATVNDIARMIGGDTVHIEPRIEPRHTKADITRAKEFLGWEPTISFQEGLAALKAEFGL